MNDDQLATCLRPYCRRRPFRPFEIEFVSGKTVKVTHPEVVAPIAGVWLYKTVRGAHIVFASSAVCRLIELDPDE